MEETEPVTKEEYDTAQEIVGRLEYNQPESKSGWRGENMIALDNLIKSQSSQQNKDIPTSYGGGGSVDVDTFTNKLKKVESGGDYNAVNKGSGAYGRYQFIPSTLKEYAKKTGQTVSQAKTPEGQDKMFAKFTEDNMNGLKRRGLPTTELAMWVAHNQGLGGATAIFKGSKLSPKIRKNIASNLPEGIEPTAENYLKHWSSVFDS